MHVAATEIREALGVQSNWLERIALDLEDLAPAITDRRTLRPGRGARSGPADVFGGGGPAAGGSLAERRERIWVIAAELDAADPEEDGRAGDTPYPDKRASDLEEGIDLSGPPEVSDPSGVGRYNGVRLAPFAECVCHGEGCRPLRELTEGSVFHSNRNGVLWPWSQRWKASCAIQGDFGADAFADLELHFFGTAHTPVHEDTIAIYSAIEGGPPGLGPVALNPVNWTFSLYPPPGPYSAQLATYPPITYTITGAGTIYGYYVSDSGASVAYWGKALGPFVFTAAGGTFTITLQPWLASQPSRNSVPCITP